MLQRRRKLKYFICLIGADGKWSLFFFFFSNLIASFADFLVFFFLKLLLFRLQSIATPYFFYNSLIEIKFTDLAVHSLKAYNLMTIHRIVHLSSQEILGHTVIPKRKPTPFQPLPPNLGHPLASGNHESAFCFHPLASPGHFSLMGSNNTWSFVTGFFQRAPVSWYHPSLFSVLLVVSFLKDVKGRILVCTDVYLNMVGSPGFVFVVTVVNGNAVSWGGHTHMSERKASLW